jgi:hydrogenase maturation factor
MCVGLSAKVVKVSDGTALMDASGAKRRSPRNCWRIWSPAIT